VNQCPKMAITTFFETKPKWQYKGVEEGDGPDCHC
jgi:hypothetical protein